MGRVPYGGRTVLGVRYCQGGWVHWSVVNHYYHHNYERVLLLNLPAPFCLPVLWWWLWLWLRFWVWLWLCLQLLICFFTITSCRGGHVLEQTIWCDSVFWNDDYIEWLFTTCLWHVVYSAASTSITRVYTQWGYGIQQYQSPHSAEFWPLHCRLKRFSLYHFTKHIPS
jgi:hypothetical protein